MSKYFSEWHWKWDDLKWIDAEKEKPSSKIFVFVKNGKKIYEAKFIRNKWKAFTENKIIQLHQVTHWAHHPIWGLKIKDKDYDEYMNRAKKYRNQMQKKEFNPFNSLIRKNRTT